MVVTTMCLPEQAERKLDGGIAPFSPAKFAILQISPDPTLISDGSIVRASQCGKAWILKQSELSINILLGENQ